MGPGRRAGRPRGLWDRWPHFLPAPTGSQRQWAPRKAARPPLGARSSGAAALRPRTRARGRAAWAARRARAAGRLRRLLGSAEVAPRGGGGAAAEEEEPGPPQPLTAARVNKPRRRRGPAAAPARAGAGAEAEAEPCPGRRPGRGRAAAPPRLRAVTLLPARGPRRAQAPPPVSPLGRGAPEPPRRSPGKVSPPGLPRVSGEGAGPGGGSAPGAGPEESRPDWAALPEELAPRPGRAGGGGSGSLARRQPGPGCPPGFRNWPPGRPRG